jgi:hypothetical protein
MTHPDIVVVVLFPRFFSPLFSSASRPLIISRPPLLLSSQARLRAKTTILEGSGQIRGNGVPPLSASLVSARSQSGTFWSTSRAVPWRRWYPIPSPMGATRPVVTPMLNRFLHTTALCELAVSYFLAFFFFSTFLVPFPVWRMMAGGTILVLLPLELQTGQRGLHLLAAARGVWGHGRMWIERKRGRKGFKQGRDG